jgi:hypothetical protein
VCRRSNKGASGADGMTFADAVETYGSENWPGEQLCPVQFFHAYNLYLFFNYFLLRSFIFSALRIAESVCNCPGRALYLWLL